MKKFTFGLIVIVFLSSTFSVVAQNTKQLWYCWEETVNPQMIEKYFELNKELVQLCKDGNYNYTFHAWTSGDLKYQFYHPINSLSDIDELEAGWMKIFSKLSAEKQDEYSKTVVSNHSFTFTEKYDLSYLPENPRFVMDSVKYMKIQEIHIIAGKEQEIEATVKDANKLLKSKNHNDAWHMATGGIGLEGPVYIGWSFGTSQLDYIETDNNFNEKFGEEFKELNKRFISCVRAFESRDSWLIRDLSYIAN